MILRNVSNTILYKASSKNYPLQGNISLYNIQLPLQNSYKPWGLGNGHIIAYKSLAFFKIYDANRKSASKAAS